VAWLRRQPWFRRPVALHGTSAMGFARWAIAADVTELRAMSVHVAESARHREVVEKEVPRPAKTECGGAVDRHHHVLNVSNATASLWPERFTV
jgi:hypothetical protein